MPLRGANNGARYLADAVGEEAGSVIVAVWIGDSLGDLPGELGLVVRVEGPPLPQPVLLALQLRRLDARPQEVALIHALAPLLVPRLEGQEPLGRQLRAVRDEVVDPK
eukprot:1347102-Pyramimonas_sp.AAC.2